MQTKLINNTYKAGPFVLSEERSIIPPFIFPEDIIQYQCNFIELLNNRIYSRLKVKISEIISYTVTSLVYLQTGNVKKSKYLMKIVNIDKENLHIFQITWEISMKLSGRMCLMIILKDTKSRALSSLWKVQFRKNHKGGSTFTLSVQIFQG